MNNIVTTDEVVKRLKKVSDTQDKRNEKHYLWSKNSLTISITLFGLILVLKSQETKLGLEFLFFVMSIFSLGLGILFRYNYFIMRGICVNP